MHAMDTGFSPVVGTTRRQMPWWAWILALVVLGLIFWQVARYMEHRRISALLSAPAEADVDPKNSGLADVPDYASSADARVTGRTETETHIRVSMETINGVLSPVGFYRDRLQQNGWSITDDSAGSEGGMLEAEKDGRTISITFRALPDSAGATLEMIVEK